MLPAIEVVGPFEYVPAVMPNLSVVPGSPQSSAWTLNDSVLVPVDRVTAAVPVNSACVPGPHDPVVKMSVSNEVALMRTSADLSSYSRLPVGVPPLLLTTNPKLACDAGSAKLGTRPGTDRSRPSSEKTGSPETWPPPVTFPVEVPHTFWAVVHVLGSSSRRWTVRGRSGKQA